MFRVHAAISALKQKRPDDACRIIRDESLQWCTRGTTLLQHIARAIHPLFEPGYEGQPAWTNR